MSDVDKTTIKLRAYSGNGTDEGMRTNLTEEQSNTLELVKKTAQLKEEMKMSLELQQAIEQLQRDIEQAKQDTEQAATPDAKEERMAELEAKAKELTEALGKFSGVVATGKPGS